jgi:methyl-accepting chemotaxis protein
MMNLMYDMTRQVGLMTGHVASLAHNVTEMNHKIGAMTEHMAHMDQNMAAMTRHMGRIDQMIHQSGETFKQWNPMDMMQPKGSGRR